MICNSVNAFEQLRNLVGKFHPPVGRTPVHLHLGEQRLVIPTGILSTIEVDDGWSGYPPLGGTDGLRKAYNDWLRRRFNFAVERLSDQVLCEPTPGAKQALAIVITQAVQRKAPAKGEAPQVVVPRYSYPTYQAAASAAGARLLVYDQQADLVSDDIAAQLTISEGPVAAIVVCNPDNPTGRVLEEPELRALMNLAEDWGATLIIDECYIDLWMDRPPGGALHLLQEPRSKSQMLISHTLSKRSGAPGLRSGFLVGDRQAVKAYADYNRVCGVSLARPVCGISAALWQDEAHVTLLQSSLRETWAITDKLMGDVSNYTRPSAGFFLWIPVEDSEDITKKLWHDDGILVMPGKYLKFGDFDNGEQLRVSLAVPPETLVPSLERLRSHLG